MFEVGFTEIILILGIALLVLGPERLPKLAADLGRWAGRARSMARQLRTQLEQEVQFDPLASDKPSKTASPSKSATIHTPPPPPAPPTVDAEASGTATGPVGPAVATPVSTDTTPTIPDERQPG